MCLSHSAAASRACRSSSRRLCSSQFAPGISLQCSAFWMSCLRFWIFVRSELFENSGKNPTWFCMILSSSALLCCSCCHKYLLLSWNVLWKRRRSCITGWSKRVFAWVATWFSSFLLTSSTAYENHNIEKHYGRSNAAHVLRMCPCHFEVPWSLWFLLARLLASFSLIQLFIPRGGRSSIHLPGFLEVRVQRQTWRIWF